jgi:hypothetical protein
VSTGLAVNVVKNVTALVQVPELAPELASQELVSQELVPEPEFPERE